MIRLPRPPAWAAAVFLVALVARAAFAVLADQPLLYAHQYHYFTNGLRIAAHPEALRWVLTSDEWRTWDNHWTIAPLYHLFLGLWFTVVGPGLAPLRAVQSLLDATTAVAVAALARQVAGRHGAWAGVAYALWWPAVEMPSWTMTENLHTPLFTASLAVLAREADAPRRARAVLGGVLLGVSALVRSVSSGFLFVVAVWRWWSGGRRGSGGLVAPALVLAGGLAVILPWTARNALLAGDAVLIESAAFENIWYANHFVDRQRFLRQEKAVHGQPTPSDKRAAALHFAMRGIRAHPDLFVQKVRTNFWHFFRPEGMHSALRVQRSLEPWRHVGLLLLDDLVLVLTVPLALVFLLAGRNSPTRGLVALWIGYYLFMVVIVFHNEIRYRSAFMPCALVAAAGGVAVLADRERRRRPMAVIAVIGGLLMAAGMVQPYVGDAGRAFSSWRTLGAARQALERGDLASARAQAEAAAARDPRSPRPWLDFGRALAAGGHAEAAVEAYERGHALSNFANWRGLIGLSRLEPMVGRDHDARRRVRTLDRFSFDQDPWLILEAAWREIPSPVTDEVLMARSDYGAVRGFLHPRGLDPVVWAHRLEWNHYGEMGGPQPPPGPHRWTRHRAWVRLRPTRPAAEHEVTIEMGVPFPSPLGSAEVKVTASDGATRRFTVGADVRPYAFRMATPSGEPVVLRIDTPVWSRPGEPADQGVRIDRVSVRPASVTAAAARVTRLEGTVKVKRRGLLDWIAATERMELTTGDLVRTWPGAAAELTFADGFVIELRPDALITIAPPQTDGRAASLSLGAGGLSADARGGGAQTEIETSVARWRGEERGAEPPRVDIDVTPSNDTTFSQRRGRAQLIPRTGTARALEPRKRVVVDASGAAGATLELPEAPTLVSPPHATTLAYPDPARSTVRLAWRSAPGAASYRLLVDRGGFFLQPLLDQAGIRETSWELTGLPEGKYYWKVAAVVKGGAESFSEFARFTIARRTDAPPSLVIDVLERRGSVIQIAGRTDPDSVVTVSGQRIEVRSDGAFSEFVTLAAPGTATVTIRAVGAGGGVNEQTRVVGRP